nr:hypothetical protein GCM10023233_29740 [Brevibacterium otitidis]
MSLRHTRLQELQPGEHFTCGAHGTAPLAGELSIDVSPGTTLTVLTSLSITKIASSAVTFVQGHLPHEQHSTVMEPLRLTATFVQVYPKGAVPNLLTQTSRLASMNM